MTATLRPDRDAWKARQTECDQWYEHLIATPETAAWVLAHDYEPHAPFLASLHGDVLDVGGGNGIVRHYLSSGCRYVTLEPSTAWLGAGWGALADRFPCLRDPLHFVCGVGEQLPFIDESFDAVLALWSLNHVSDPARVLAQVARVLRVGGRALLVLEDMPPRWRDLISRGYWSDGFLHGAAATVRRAALAALRRPWALQSDHIRIDEAVLQSWLAEFDVVRRTWRGQYLTYELRRRAH